MFTAMKKFSSLLIVLLLMFASFTAGLEYPRGDVDQDGKVTIGDVTCLVDYLLNGTWEDEPVTPDEHEWVDLGLPSGTLWATCNVGADTPEGYGDYFAWGETEPKDYYDRTTYKWYEGSWDSSWTLIKYCMSSSYGTVDNMPELVLEDDAAYVNWGSSWIMPTTEQHQELVDNCTWTWTQQNGVNGQLGVGPNGNTIFLPATGYWRGGSPYNAGSNSRFWSRTLYSSSISAFGLSLSSYGFGCYDEYRSNGLTVRAVRMQ